ncbi:MAG: hypothetical protein KF760_08930 [Candidatus Eremiobacteraeota bacterium]|nr:hypothetical protein [Candidatus Eremiobacteraeota bacterium]MCW5869059.1 hypothetical protein [Candidatus Eremiobacteraeota bacterium]
MKLLKRLVIKLPTPKAAACSLELVEPLLLGSRLLIKVRHSYCHLTWFLSLLYSAINPG